jgi:hypothetical protein
MSSGIGNSGTEIDITAAQHQPVVVAVIEQFSRRALGPGRVPGSIDVVDIQAEQQLIPRGLQLREHRLHQQRNDQR